MLYIPKGRVINLNTVISIEDLTKVYKNNRGIHNITLDIDRGSIFGFLGPNGAGKTTAMKIMTGLMRPDSGDVKINGFSITEDYTNAMRDVGCIIESVTPFPYLSGYENMTLCARFHNIGKERIEECLEMTGILKYKDEKVRNYSLGMKQRIGISMAILSNPSILILDEPLNGLDVEGMVEMRNLILRLAANGATFFISSHLIHDVELTCDRIGILHDGRLLRADTMKNILQNYSSLENFYLSEVDLSVNSADAS